MLVNILFCHFYDGHRILRNCLLFSQKAKNTLIYSVRKVGIRNATSTRSTKVRQFFPSGCQKCILNKKTVSNKFKGKSVARACIYMPAIISPLIMGYIWYLLLQPGRGVIFNLLNQMGHPEWFPNWMSSYTSEIVVLVLVNVWQYAGMTMIIYLAGLQNISQDLYDAAMIDGATGWQSFRFITLPLLVPSIRINVVTNIIGSLSVFDIVMSLTSGGPGYQTETLSIYIMRMCYGSKTGYSTAVAMIMFLIVLIPVLISLRLTRTRD